MTIFDDLVEIARERHFGHETSRISDRDLCRVTRIPVEWCGGCRKGLHKHTYQPFPGTEHDADFELPAAEVVSTEVTPAEITPADATPQEVEPPSVKLSEIITDVGSKVLGVPRERIDASALDAEVAGIAYVVFENFDLEKYAATQSPEKVEEAITRAALEQWLKDGVDEGRKP